MYRNAPYQSSSTRYYPSDDWASIFDKEKDLRWTKFVLKDHGYNTTVGDVVYDDGIQLVYYRDELSITEGVTYPLLLLMKAEAAARTNNLSAALADLNLLRKYRYKGPDSDLAGGTSLSQDQLLNEILTERRREQPLVSFQRTLDLKRYAQDAGKPWSKDIMCIRSARRLTANPLMTLITSRCLLTMRYCNTTHSGVSQRIILSLSPIMHGDKR